MHSRPSSSSRSRVASVGPSVVCAALLCAASVPGLSGPPVASAQQAGQIAQPWTMRGDTALVFYAVRVDQAAAFEAGMTALETALDTSDKAERQRQRAGWRVYRQVEPWLAGGVVYLFLLDPVVPGADYSPAAILAENPPADPTIRPAYVTSLLGGQTVLDLSRAMDFGAGVDPETLPPEPVRFEGPPPLTAPMAGSEPRVFTGDLGIMLMRVDPDLQPDFESALARLTPALTDSLDPQRRRQAIGWRYYTPAPPPPGTATPVRRRETDKVVPVTVAFIMDPPLAGADYSVSRIVSDAFPDQSASLFKTYREAFVGGVSVLNYTLLLDFRQ